MKQRQIEQRGCLPPGWDATLPRIQDRVLKKKIMNEDKNRGRLHLPVLILFSLCLLGLTSCGSRPSESMTPTRFQQIVNMPADTVPLSAPLSSLPRWPQFVTSNVMTYAAGRVFQEELKGTTRTVGGKYIVSAVQSRFYQQPLHSIVAYDAQASAIKTYGLSGDGRGGSRVTEGLVAFDFAKKTYTMTSTYEGFQETTTGNYADREDRSKTVVYKDGALFLTREVITRPASR